MYDLDFLHITVPADLACKNDFKSTIICFSPCLLRYQNLVHLH